MRTGHNAQIIVLWLISKGWLINQKENIHPNKKLGKEV